MLRRTLIAAAAVWFGLALACAQTPNANLLRMNGGCNAQAQAALARMAMPPAGAQRQAYCNLVSTLVSNNLWNDKDGLWIMAAPNLGAAETNLIAKNYSLLPISSPTFAANLGFTGNGSTSTLDTQFNPSTAGGYCSINSCTVAAYSVTNVSDSSVAIYIGAYGGNYTYIGKTATSNITYNVNDSTSGNYNFINQAGLWATSRTASNVRAAYQSGVQIASDAIAAVGLPTATIHIGNMNGAGYFSKQTFAAAFIGAGETPAQMLVMYNAIHTYIKSVAALSSQLPIVMFDGNSITAGVGITGSANYYPSVAASSMQGAGHSFNWFNHGVNGQTTPQMNVYAALHTDNLSGSTPLLIDVAFEITNDIFVNNITGAQAYANIIAYTQARQARGEKVVMLDCLPTGRSGWTGAMETARLAANALILANPSQFDAVIDIASVAGLTDPTNLTYYQADQLHPTAAGAALIAAAVAPVVGAFLP